ncbi:MAG: hypothetical protein QM572_18545 [Nocardioides sp.]
MDDAVIDATEAAMGVRFPRLASLIPFAYDAGGNVILSPGRDASSPVPLIWLPQTNDLEPCEGLTLADLLPPRATD